MSLTVILTSVVGTASTCVGILVGWQSYRKSKYEADKLKKASTVDELPPATTANDSLISTLSVLSHQLEGYRDDVNVARGEVSTLRTSLDACLGREANRTKPI